MSVCPPGSHPLSLLSDDLVPKTPWTFRFLSGAPRERGVYWELELNIRNSSPDSALKRFQILWHSESQQLNSLYLLHVWSSCSLLIASFSIFSLIVHYQKKHF